MESTAALGMPSRLEVPDRPRLGACCSSASKPIMIDDAKEFEGCDSCPRALKLELELELELELFAPLLVRIAEEDEEEDEAEEND